MRRKHRSVTQWEQIFKRWQDSDLSVSQFCRKQNIPTSAFYRWRRKFHKKKDREQDSFIQVDWTPTKESPLELAFNTGHVFRFSETTDKKILGTTLAVLKEAGLC